MKYSKLNNNPNYSAYVRKFPHRFIIMTDHDNPPPFIRVVEEPSVFGGIHKIMLKAFSDETRKWLTDNNYEWDDTKH